jgi:flavin reductase (DIM6/NTAB) family NADH-FMN oxidoreductase RutF
MSESVSGQAFRDALAQFASGVTIVATRQGEQLDGLTATAFSSVSLDPPLVLVCVAKTASAHDAVVSAERVGISVLALEQGWVARQFARHGIDKFGGVPLVPDRGVPLVDGALAHLEGRRHARHDAGDHTIVVAEVAAAWAAGGKPLLHYARKLGGFAAESTVHPETPLTTAANGERR